LQVADGEITLDEQALKTGDGASISEETLLELTGRKPPQVLLFDLN
jgi:hypothetical protein